MSKLRRETSPYPIANDEIDIRVSLPDGGPSALELGDDLRSVSALGLEESLSFTVRFDLTIGENLVTEVLASSERGDAGRHLRVGIVETGTRPRVRDFHEAAGSFPGPFAVSRTYAVNRFFGSIEVTPVVIRSTDGSEVGYARHLGAVVAAGDKAGIHFDSPPPRAGNYIDIKYKSFSQEEGLKAFKHLMYHLDTTGADEEARLYINEDIDGLKAALTDRQAETGNSKRVRDAVFATITAHAWSQLFHRALGELRRHYSEHGAEPGDGSAAAEGALPKWAREVLESWAGTFSDSSSLSDRVAAFEQELSEKPEEVIRTVEAAIQEIAEVVESFQGMRPLAKRKQT